MTEGLIVNTPDYESYPEDANQDELVFEGDTIPIQVTNSKTTAGVSIPQRTKDGLPIKVKFMDAYDPDCILATHSVAIPPCGILEFLAKVETIGKSFRIHAESTAESTDGSKLNCKKSLRRYRVVSAKPQVEYIEGIVSKRDKNGNISSYFYTRKKSNRITLVVSMNGNVDYNLLQSIGRDFIISCIAERSDITMTEMNITEMKSEFTNKKWKIQFRLEGNTRAPPPVVLCIATKCSGVGHTELGPITVREKPGRNGGGRNDESRQQNNDLSQGVNEYSNEHTGNEVNDGMNSVNVNNIRDQSSSSWKTGSRSIAYDKLHSVNVRFKPTPEQRTHNESCTRENVLQNKETNNKPLKNENAREEKNGSISEPTSENTRSKRRKQDSDVSLINDIKTFNKRIKNENSRKEVNDRMNSDQSYSSNEDEHTMGNESGNYHFEQTVHSGYGCDGLSNHHDNNTGRQSTVESGMESFPFGFENVSPNDLDSIIISDEEFEEIKEIEEFIKSMSN